MTPPDTSYNIDINELDKILGPRPILPTESENAYDALTDKFREAVTPKDIIEDILARDAIDLTWEVQRLKNFKLQLTIYERAENIRSALDQILGPSVFEPKVIEEFVRYNPAAIKTIKAELAKRGHDISIIEALTYRRQLDKFERLDRQISQAEARRAAHLKEVDRHRSALAHQMREAVLAIDKRMATDGAPQK